MELLLLLAAVPILWLLFTPRRMLRRASDWPLFKPTVVGAVVLLGWMVVTALQGERPPDLSGVAEANLPIERRVNQTQDYARGDEELRALLSQ